MWHEKTQQARESGQLTVLGVIQEQHSERCRLFSQWQQFDWPILHDPINVLPVRAVPIFIALDEAGVVVDADLHLEELDSFLSREPVDAAVKTDNAVSKSGVPKTGSPAARAEDIILWGQPESLSEAIELLTAAIKTDLESASLQFQLGVALRLRYDSSFRQADDFQRAISAWDRALELDPNHYIYRRRIQQYGPRLSKPYPFYDWVAQARHEVTERGETPVHLHVEPQGAEIAEPLKQFLSEQQEVEPDPDNKIAMDTRKLITAEVVTVPSRAAPGEPRRVHIDLRPSHQVHWNNETEGVQLVLRTPDGWQLSQTKMVSPQPKSTESSEPRHFELEIQIPQDADSRQIEAYALYYVCEDRGGQCLYLRQDIPIDIVVD
ncbi:MAG: tetratricopeptide repeat protein [Planctomycetales bacterium]|nr:tetratricopeptide repeat protein [Planctomycetales bacterium]